MNPTLPINLSSLVLGDLEAVDMADRRKSQWRTSSFTSKNAKRAERFATPQTNPITSDNLDDFGFVSKGDDRLKDYHNQERYNKHINQKYFEFCGSSPSGSDTLELDFASLALTPLNRPSRSSSTNHVYNDTRNAELSSILLMMRKLREGITASRRIDAFSIDVFKHHIRAAILVQQIESYHPTLLHLLYTMHPARPLPPQDIQEFGAYYMLHLAARLEDYGGALGVKHEFNLTDQRALQAVSAMIHGNYWSFRAARNRVDQYIGRLMDFAEERMRELMLGCVGKTYFTIEKGYLETVSGLGWERLREENKVGWELDAMTGTVTVRRPKLKTSPQPVQQPKTQPASQGNWGWDGPG